MDKRIKAYEAVERMIAHLDKTVRIEGENQKFLACCYPMSNTKSFLKTLEKLKSIDCGLNKIVENT